MNMDFTEEYVSGHRKRFLKTLDIVLKTIPPPAKILDLGPVNPISQMMSESDYDVTNTPKDMDLDYAADSDLIKDKSFDAVTCFEVFEHLVNPFGILDNLGADLLITTVPLKLWFSPGAYWNEQDKFDRHFHEFEDRQFDMLLEKTHWKIVQSEKWIYPSKKFGVRPFLRSFYPRYYLVVAERVKS